MRCVLQAGPSPYSTSLVVTTPDTARAAGPVPRHTAPARAPAEAAAAALQDAGDVLRTRARLREQRCVAPRARAPGVGVDLTRVRGSERRLKWLRWILVVVLVAVPILMAVSMAVRDRRKPAAAK